MASFKDIRESIVSCYAEDMLDDEEFFALYDFYSSKNPDFPYDSYPPFDLGEMDDSECLAEFRVHKRDIPALANHLRIPDNFYCQQRSVSDGIEGLCMLLRQDTKYINTYASVCLTKRLLDPSKEDKATFTLVNTIGLI